MARVSRRKQIAAAQGVPVDELPKAAALRVFRTALYVRLSIMDTRDRKDSESLQTQIDYLCGYIAKHPDLELYDCYRDNGETGTNFERPGFQRMMEDVKAGRVDCIIVKDLSRFGRDFLETGNFLEKVLPFMGVRFISVNDNYDSIRADSGEAMTIALKNLMNDIYAKDISQKVYSALDTKKRSGEFIGNFAAYGYVKSPEDRHTEIRFPEMGVRFVAVNDGVDSDNAMDNDFTPFRNIINEWYAKDTSKKIRAVFRNKGMSGQHLATNVPYGYLKGADGQWVIDEEAEPVVVLIFQLCVEGNGPGKIARMLKERKIPTPGTLEFQRTGRTRNYHPDNPYGWNESSIANILEQDAYLGRTSNFKTTKLSYKSKKTIENPPEKWAVFENTHKAIIDRETWDIVQKAREQRRRPTKMGEMGMFSGLTYCADCGGKLFHSRTGSWTHEQECYTCSTYRNRKGCSAHYIRVVVLEQLVLQNIQRVVAYANYDEDEFVRQVIQNKMAVQLAEQEQAKRKLEKQMRRSVELDTIIQRLYEDNIVGKLSDERFKKLSTGYEKEQAELSESISGLQKVVETSEAETVNIQSFLKLVKKYTEPTELTPALLREFVEKVVVHAPDKSSGHRVQRIDVHYNFIGEIDFSPEYSGHHKKSNSTMPKHHAVAVR